MNEEHTESIESLKAKLSEANFLVEHYKNSFKAHYDRAERAEAEVKRLNELVEIKQNCYNKLKEEYIKKVLGGDD
jgi:DNA repair exonuclease SbcCD ATPase subunit